MTDIIIPIIHSPKKQLVLFRAKSEMIINQTTLMFARLNSPKRISSSLSSMNNSPNQLGHDLFNKYVPKKVQKGNNIVGQRKMSNLELAILPQLSHDDTKVPVSQREKSKSEQLTIFYGGIVHVYDNIHVQKAESIINLARQSSSQISGSINAKEIKPTQKSQVPQTFKFQADLPIARRKSLKRFFEKRNNRIISKHPYASPECDHDQSANDNLKENEKLVTSSICETN